MQSSLSRAERISPAMFSVIRTAAGLASLPVVKSVSMSSTSKAVAIGIIPSAGLSDLVRAWSAQTYPAILAKPRRIVQTGPCGSPPSVVNHFRRGPPPPSEVVGVGVRDVADGDRPDRLVVCGDRERLPQRSHAT